MLQGPKTSQKKSIHYGLKQIINQAETINHAGSNIQKLQLKVIKKQFYFLPACIHAFNLYATIYQQ